MAEFRRVGIRPRGDRADIRSAPQQASAGLTGGGRGRGAPGGQEGQGQVGGEAQVHTDPRTGEVVRRGWAGGVGR